MADEAIGDYEDALKNYELASAAHSNQAVMVTLDRSWAGKPVSAMADASAKRLEKRLRDRGGAETQAAMLSMHGVFAVNQNNSSIAMADFMRAYALDPESAFSLNNRGYVAEREGDLESAQFFYEKARKAADAGTRVGFASEQFAEGRALFTVAGDSDKKVDGALDVYSRERHMQTGPVGLTPRGAGSSDEPTTTPPQQPATPTTPSTLPPSSPQQR